MRQGRRLPQSKPHLPQLLSVVVAAMFGCTSAVAPEPEPNLPPLAADTDYPLTVVAAEEVSPTRDVPLTLINDGPTRLYYNLCFDGFAEHRAARGWIEVPRDPIPCPAIAYALLPGESAATRIQIAASGPAGIYRVRVELRQHSGGALVIRRSNVIAVTQ